MDGRSSTLWVGAILARDWAQRSSELSPNMGLFDALGLERASMLLPWEVNCLPTLDMSSWQGTSPEGASTVRVHIYKVASQSWSRVVTPMRYVLES